MTDVKPTQAAGAAAITGYAPKVNRDYTIYPTVGALTGTGRTPRLFPQGQTAQKRVHAVDDIPIVPVGRCGRIEHPLGNGTGFF